MRKINLPLLCFAYSHAYNMEQATGRLTTELKDEPLVRADAQVTIGRTYRKLALRRGAAALQVGAGNRRPRLVSACGVLVRRVQRQDVDSGRHRELLRSQRRDGKGRCLVLGRRPAVGTGDRRCWLVKAGTRPVRRIRGEDLAPRRRALAPAARRA